MSRTSKFTSFNHQYPSVEDLRAKAKKRMPKFAFDYLDGGCNENVNISKNTTEIREVELTPYYLKKHEACSLKTELFGHTYDAPFGISPIGLQGLMWPNAPEILAKSAFENNIPFILSTVGTASIERISEVTEGQAWFQFYHPAKQEITDDIIRRATESQCKVLVLLCDVPTFGFRPTEIKNGLSMPPRMTIKNILQVVNRPSWAWNTLKHGIPEFKVLKPYMDKHMNLSQLGEFMNQTFTKKMDEDKIAAIRDKWKGKLVLKGVSSQVDTETAIRLGLDGIIVSNHGGRQLDAGESTIKPLTRIAEKYGNQITVMMDSGLRSGPDVARTLASGAQFTFLGRLFMYGVGALGNKGGNHTISLLKTQLQQVMEQVGCAKVEDFPNHLVP